MRPSPRRSMNVTSLSVVVELKRLISSSFPSWRSTGDDGISAADAVERTVARRIAVEANKIGERPDLDALAGVHRELARMCSSSRDARGHGFRCRAGPYEAASHLFLMNQQNPQRRRNEFERHDGAADALARFRDDDL